MSALASAYWRLNNQKLAVSYMEEDLEICRSLGDEQGECRVMGNLGNLLFSAEFQQPLKTNMLMKSTKII